MHIIEIRMNSIKCDVIFNRFNDYPFHIGASIQLFQTFEDNRMVSNYKVAAFIDCLLHDRFGYIQRDQHIVYNSFRRSEEHTSELQSRENLVCRLLLEKKKEI